MITYAKLWQLLEKREMKKTDLLKILSSSTVAKLGKNVTLNTDTIDKLCDFLKCQPGDIMEHISDEQLKKTSEQLKDMNKILASLFEKDQGLKEAIEKQLDKASEASKLFHKGDFLGSEIIDEALKKDPTE